MKKDEMTKLGDEELTAVSGAGFYVRVYRWGVSAGWEKTVDPQAPDLTSIPASPEEPSVDVN